MYVIRNGPIQRHALQFRAGKLPRPIFICCGSIGLSMLICGSVVLAMGQKKYRGGKEDGSGSYTLLLAGSIVLGIGFTTVVLSVFLTISWSNPPHYEAPSRASVPTLGSIDVDIEMNGYRHQNRDRPSIRR